ncbi:maltose phosphorylase [Companilactobacillus nodensis DSM 19682 = JCM 14932 = NBRC 107160]|uniref:Maltose phosphorylase n=1 Tax=Companilactobacillus nodensis DSM 19682 = JCM 14932 = NBRC 107160 TaxID=1423775 RepID=A0A0R1K6X7_9LACO|nr:glycosyl hydrolase family 65 protein [Companilactobacillus nodensis]KRK79216.1 maltose phosphorylase [Companilactobacillus nodensis DSM 19682 = JCM 14932 = NBRC 107160]
MDSNKFILNLKDLQEKDAPFLETIFSIANGHFGVRASNPITDAENFDTLVNGFYEKSPIHYGESAYGYAKFNQTIVKVTNLRHIKVTNTDGIDFNRSELISMKLNMKNGTLTEDYHLFNTVNDEIRMEITSCISQHDRNWYSISYKFTPITYHGKLTISKTVLFDTTAKVLNSGDPRKSNISYPLSVYGERQKYNSYNCILATKQSNLTVPFTLRTANKQDQLINMIVDINDSPTVPYIIGIGDISKTGDVESLSKHSIKDINIDAQEFWANVWQNSEVTIDGAPRLNTALLYNIFQLNQSAGKDGKTSLAAKGLSGTGYEGHYFWDTETYALPYFSYTSPKIARRILKYRYSTLPQAKKRAAELGVKNGALFAWRTINGEEASAFFPAGTAQYHIDADIAYAVDLYWKSSGDFDFIEKYGFPIILETARFWASFGNWNGDKFEFWSVTGPDEYTALVNNNYYTNRMAKHNLALAKKYADMLVKIHDVDLTQYGTNIDEILNLNQISKSVYLPFDKEKEINAQDDSFLSKPLWPFDEVPKDNYPLLLHYHPLTIYRYQVAKQADAILAEYLFPDEISDEQLNREYDYYNAVTTHDSSLSKSIFGIIASRLGKPSVAFEAFQESAFTDLLNKHGNTEDGLHVANLGGSWLSIVSGFSGLKLYDDKISIENHVPEQIQGFTYHIMYKNSLLKITLNHDFSKVKLMNEIPAQVELCGTEVILNKDKAEIKIEK